MQETLKDFPAEIAWSVFHYVASVLRSESDEVKSEEKTGSQIHQSVSYRRRCLGYADQGGYDVCRCHSPVHLH